MQELMSTGNYPRLCWALYSRGHLLQVWGLGPALGLGVGRSRLGAKSSLGVGGSHVGAKSLLL